MFWAEKALESPGWWRVELIQTNCWSASAHSVVRETPRTLLCLWHPYTRIVTLAHRNRCSGDGGDGGGGYALCNIIIFIWKICLFYYAFWMFRLVTMMWQWLTVDLTPLTRSTDINTNKLLINIYCCKGAHDQLSLSLMDGLRLIQSWVTTLSMNVVVVKT